jgi:hypothetical protein
MNLLKNDSSVNLLNDDVTFSNDYTPCHRKTFAQVENDYFDNTIIVTGEESPTMKPSYSNILLEKLSYNN